MFNSPRDAIKRIKPINFLYLSISDLFPCLPKITTKRNYVIPFKSLYRL